MSTKFMLYYVVLYEEIFLWSLPLLVLLLLVCFIIILYCYCCDEFLLKSPITRVYFQLFTFVYLCCSSGRVWQNINYFVITLDFLVMSSFCTVSHIERFMSSWYKYSILRGQWWSIIACKWNLLVCLTTQQSLVWVFVLYCNLKHQIIPMYIVKMLFSATIHIKSGDMVLFNSFTIPSCSIYSEC